MSDTIIPFIWFCVAAIGVCVFCAAASVVALFNFYAVANRRRNRGFMKNIGITKEIDTLGRLQIPKDVRERLGLSREVELLITSDGLLIRSSEYKLVKIEKGAEK